MNFFKKFSHRNSAPARDFIAAGVPERDWNIILVVCAILFFIIIGVAAAFYWWSTQASEALPASSGSTALSPEKISALLSRYQALDQEHAALLTNPPAFADPAGGQ